MPAGHLTGMILTNLGLTAALEAGFDRAGQLCQDVPGIFLGSHHLNGLFFALEGPAAAYTTQDPTRAVTLFSAVAALRSRYLLPHTDTNLVYIRRLFEAARPALPPEDLASAWARGNTLSLEAIVTLASDRPWEDTPSNNPNCEKNGH